MKPNDTMDTITNEKKYKTVEERISAFDKFCKQPNCDGCPVAHACGHSRAYASIAWLALVAEDEKLENCPFCHSETEIVSSNYVYQVSCVHCLYLSEGCTNEKAAIAAHNRVARAVAKAMEGPVK